MTTPNDKVMDRIAKLYALASDEAGNANEAANAIAKVQALLDEHNLELATALQQAGENPRTAEPVMKLEIFYGSRYDGMRKSWELVMDSCLLYTSPSPRD